MIFPFISIKQPFWDMKLGIWWWWFLNDRLNDLISTVKLLAIHHKKAPSRHLPSRLNPDSFSTTYGKIFREACGSRVLFHLLPVHPIGKLVSISETTSWYFENLNLVKKDFAILTFYRSEWTMVMGWQYSRVLWSCSSPVEMLSWSVSEAQLLVERSLLETLETKTKHCRTSKLLNQLGKTQFTFPISNCDVTY